MSNFLTVKQQKNEENQEFNQRIFNAKRIGTLAMLLFCGVAATYAQNAAGDYTAGTNALTTVTEENAFWINHTQIKYDKMNIKLKKTRYK